MRESSALSRASPAMNIHEYQAKELLQKFGVATPRGKVASSPEEAEQIARELAPAETVVKAQIHAGEGKGRSPMDSRGAATLAKRRRKRERSRARCLGKRWSHIKPALPAASS